MSYEFNGLVDSVLPNIYINRITLERLHSQPLSNNKYDTTPHINQSKLPDLGATQVTATTYEMGGEIFLGQAPVNTSLTPTYNAKDSLRVVFDMFLEIPNIDNDDFWSVILSDDILKYLTVELFLFSGAQGKHYYRSQVVGKQISYNKLSQLSAQPSIHHVTNESLFSQLVDSGKFVGGGYSGAQALEHVKEKYAETLPDGTIVHKVPIRMSAELNDGAFPSDLAAATFCALNMNAVVDDSSVVIPSDEISSTVPYHGRIASEVIIKDGKVQDKGMIFYISKNQSDDNEDISIQRDIKFANKKGELWFGGVHSHNGRYMAGNAHTDTIHPYLDYLTVPNTRIQDYRQITAMQKQMINFASLPDMIFGGDYVDRRSSSSAITTNNTAIFSDLISSVDKLGHVKTFFTFDLGRLFKKYCAVPALIDKLALQGTQQLGSLFAEQPRPISFKVYRERISAPANEGSHGTKELIVPPQGNRSFTKSVVDQDNEKLVYDGYPNLHYFDNEKKHVSSLVPVFVGTQGAANTFLKSYSLTDRSLAPKPGSTAEDKFECNITSGVYKYSVKIEMHDPTLNWFVNKYKEAQAAVMILKRYSVLANGTTDVGTATETPYYNKHLGKFNSKFIEEAKTTAGIGTSNNSNVLPPTVINALNSFKFISKIVRARNTPAVSEVAVEDHEGPTNDDWVKPIENMLNPAIATPSTIASVCEIFNTFTSQIKNFIESFSTAKIPKTSSGTDTNGNPILQQFTKTTVGASLPQRKMIIEHVFDANAELVDTRQMNAGHDVFADISGLSQYDIGLKIIASSRYLIKAETEHAKYFKDSSTLQLDYIRDEKNYPIYVDPKATKGRFLTVPQSDAFFNRTYTILPETIKSWDEENEYWKLANNIIRYKFGLFGNPGPKSYLGYGDQYEDLTKNPDSSFINDAMERIIKEYQSLSYKGTVFTAETSPPEDPTTQPPLGTQVEQEIGPTTPSFLSPADNVVKERFLLALIMQDYLNLRFQDLKLGSFDISVPSSNIKKYLNEAVNSEDTIQMDVQSVVNNLPNQIKVLMLQYAGQEGVPGGSAGFINNLNDKVVYSAWKSIQPDNFYAEGVNDSNMETMYTSKFGEFWFRHQNLMEIQYLSGYENAKPIPAAAPASQITEKLDTGTVYAPPEIAPIVPISTYEDKFSASIKRPVWAPVTKALINQLTPQGSTLLLCRLKKYKHPILNQKAYDILDLPLYDEYFFLWTGPQIGGPLDAQNAEIPSPNKDIQTTEGAIQMKGTMKLSS